VIARNGMVASSQPLASMIGVDVMRRGGNAVDAAIAVAAALAVTEPCSTGLGGDCFLLYYDAKTKRVSALNGSGRAPATLTLGAARAIALDHREHQRSSGVCGVPAEVEKTELDELDDLELPPMHAATVTVPGAAQGWCDAVEAWGSGNLALSELLEPAAVLADEGFPVAPLCAHAWSNAEWLLSSASSSRDQCAAMLVESEEGVGEAVLRAPRAGEVFRRPELASVLRRLGAQGRAAFYEGAVAESIAAEVQALGGSLSTQDLKEHASTFPEPLSAVYRGVRLHEVPPNGQGLTALVALNILSHLEAEAEANQAAEAAPLSPPARPPPPPAAAAAEAAMSTAPKAPPLPSLRVPWQESAWHTHALVESMRIAFADTRFWVCGTDRAAGDAVAGAEAGARAETFELLNDPSYGARRAVELFRPESCALEAKHGCPERASSTVSFQVVDPSGNAVSMVNSNYMGFGTGIVPKHCGFTLHNRGHNFSLDSRHPNVLAPNKRPYHTIIPAITTWADGSGDLHATLSNMGGFMQPQGHVQLLVSLLACGLGPQEAVDAPRFCIRDGTAGGALCLEDGFSRSVVGALEVKGHGSVSAAAATAGGGGGAGGGAPHTIPVLKGHDRALFGRAQIILKDRSTGVLWGASDGRADGCAIGW